MITLERQTLVFRFPEVHPDARLEVTFMRTLRIPDDGNDYPLPAGLGEFELRHVDDHAARLPASWVRHGGVMLPMYQAEAMWIDFRSHQVPEHWVPYPFAVSVAAGKINALTGEPWSDGLVADPQSYMPVPPQPWLDGFKVEEGVIRQFVAAPMGRGVTAEEQLTRAADTGGLQISVAPMRREAFERRFPRRPRPERPRFCVQAPVEEPYTVEMVREEQSPFEMGLGLGGRMRQEVYDDSYGVLDWHAGAASRCFVHLLNAPLWPAVTGEPVPHRPITAKDYARKRIPWFDYYGADRALEGSKILAGLKSLAGFEADGGPRLLPDNDSVDPETIVTLRAGLAPGQVREGQF